MIDTTPFKDVAFKKLTESLYQQLEPHLKKLCRSYRDFEDSCDQDDEYEWQWRHKRYDKIWGEFLAANKPKWPAFARERWPEIDMHFNLEPPKDDRNDDWMPF